MRSLFIILGVLVLAAAGAAFYAQNRTLAKLRSDMAGLREDIRRGPHAAQAVPTAAARSLEPASPTVAGGSTAVAGADDFIKLREEIAALRKSTQALTQFAQAAQAASALKSLGDTEKTIPTRLTPSEALKNAGKATPEAATETVLWAAFGGDVDTLSNALVFTPTAREKADAWFAGLPETMRQQYGSPEKVMALMISRDAAGLSGMQVLGQKEIAPDNVGVRIRFGSTDGKTKDDNLLMRRVDDGWRMVLPDSAVEKFARQLSGKR